MTVTQQLIAERKCTMCTNPLEPHDQVLCTSCWEEFREFDDEEKLQRELRCTD